LPTSQYWEQATYTCPLKLFEYMASKRPIVASNLPNIRNIARHEKEALLFSPDNLPSLHLQIDRVFNDSSLAKRIAEEASTRVKNYTWKLRAQQIIDFIKETR